MVALSHCAVANHVFLTIFTAYQCKVHRVVARIVHPSLLRVGKNYAWATKLPLAYGNETPVIYREFIYSHIYIQGVSSLRSLTP